METILLNALAGNYRREVVNGREFIVAPLVSIVPGVLNGSKGALLYPEDEIARDPQAWNGMPLIKGHPTRNGQHVSGRDPWVRANLQMGTIYNSVYDGKLWHEAWFDVEDTKRVDNWVYQQLVANRPIEVSTGLFTENQPSRGTFNNKSYDYVARNYRPDHMAVLVGQRGACSNADGCGINVNEEKTCSKCGYTMTDSEQEDGECKNCGETLNAGVYGNPQSTATGRFKRHGAGTGKGDVHEAAQRGQIALTDEDRERGERCRSDLANGGHNPASWVADEETWEKAKAAADKGEYGDDTYWAVVSHIYRKMGGEVNSATANSKQQDFIDCQEECDDMDCVDECLADFVGNQLGDTTMPTRNEAIQALVTNCDCWKGKQAVLANTELFSDEDVQRLLKSFNARKLAVNTLREIGIAVQAPATLTVNEMPAFVKAKMGKGDEEDTEQEVGDPETEAPAEEEEEVMNKKMTKNSKRRAPITERLSPEELEVWNNAVKITANEKKQIVTQLVANLSGDYRKEKFKKLMGKSMDDLREMLELRGSVRNEDDGDNNYTRNSGSIGAFFTPDFDDGYSERTDNADPDDEPLGLPSSHVA